MDLKVNPVLLRRAAVDLMTVQDCVLSVFDDLRSDLASRGSPWEQGSIGAAFADGADGAHGYLAAKEHLFQSAHNLATTLGDYAAHTASAADAWAVVDGEPPAGDGGS
jgi:hypothetical protein